MNAGKEIKWHPEYVQTLENWTENLSIDWCIADKDFWSPYTNLVQIDSIGNPIFDDDE